MEQGKRRRGVLEGSVCGATEPWFILPPQSFQILKLLIDNAGEIVHPGRVRQEIWNGTGFLKTESDDDHDRR